MNTCCMAHGLRQTNKQLQQTALANEIYLQTVQITIGYYAIYPSHPLHTSAFNLCLQFLHVFELKNIYVSD